MKKKKISFDIIIDFKVKDREELYNKIYDEVQGKYPYYNINITLDVDIVINLKYVFVDGIISIIVMVN